MMVERSSDPLLYDRKAVCDILERQVRLRPDAPAIFFDGQEISYRALHARSMGLARFIAARAGTDARVGYLGKESDRYYEVLFACAAAGAVLVPINWRFQPQEVRHVLTDAGVDMLFVDDDRHDVALAACDGVGGPTTVVGLQDGGALPSYASALAAEGDVQLPPPDPARLLCIMYTSGTTGLPKGVCLDNAAFFRIREALIRARLNWLDWSSTDRSLIGIPGFHIGGLWWAIQNFSAGAAVIVLPWFEPAAAAAAMERHDATTACVVPAMIHLLLDHVPQGERPFPGLRKIVYGGSPITRTLLQRGMAAFGCDFAQIYGLSETGNTAVCLDPESHVRSDALLAAAGRPYPGVDLKIVDEDGHVLPRFEVGEVCIRTPARMRGYWGLPDVTAATIRDDWVHTGDAGYLDDAGYLFIRDRLKDVVIIGGEKVFPAEVENVVSTYPAIRECAVVGVPDDHWGERAVCLVVPRPGISFDEAALVRFLSTRLAPFKVPSQTYVVDSIPRNPSGKLLRRALRQAFWEGRERAV